MKDAEEPLAADADADRQDGEEEEVKEAASAAGDGGAGKLQGYTEVASFDDGKDGEERPGVAWDNDEV